MLRDSCHRPITQPWKTFSIKKIIPVGQFCRLRDLSLCAVVRVMHLPNVVSLGVLRQMITAQRKRRFSIAAGFARQHTGIRPERTWQACVLLALMFCLPGCVHRGIHTLSWGTTFPRRTGTITVGVSCSTPDQWAHGCTVRPPLGSDGTKLAQPADGASETDITNAEGEPTLAPQAKPPQDSEPSSLLPKHEDWSLPVIDEPATPAGQPLPADDQVRRLSKPP